MTSQSPDINRWRAFALLAVAFFMTIIDLTIVNLSLPTIGRELHFSATSLQWVVTAYALTFGGFLLLGGRAADLLRSRSALRRGARASEPKWTAGGPASSARQHTSGIPRRRQPERAGEPTG
jgi:MFS family permease